jgi:hypothetical protein
MDERICASKIGTGWNQPIPGAATPEIQQKRAFTRAILPRGSFRITAGREREWSAASEGVPAALRLSKSAQSADKVHFSDSNLVTGTKFYQSQSLNHERL